MATKLNLRALARRAALGAVLPLLMAFTGTAAATTRFASPDGARMATVANQNDSGPGSLRQAIADAAPGDVVHVPSGTYMLMSELTVPKSLTIMGAGSRVTVIDAQTASRVFHTMGAGNQITISGLTIRGGRTVPVPGTTAARGGGVLNEQATLTLSDDLITGNTAFADALGRDGGGGDANGGGVFSTGRLNLVRTDVRGNSASAVGGIGRGGGGAAGGGVEVLGSTDIRSSTFEDNHADARGGQGDVDPKQTGGVASGGGLDVGENGSVSVSATTFTRNESDASSGAGSSGGNAFGGGASLEDNVGGITETNVTYAGNQAFALGGQTFGGGVFLQGDVGQSLTNATLTGNIATAGSSNLGGNLFVNVDETVTAENTIVTGGAADAGSENCSATSGKLVSRGHNIESGADCRFTATGDLQNTDPLLAALADNGGPVQTIALHTGSPAIDAGAADACPSADARGALRPAGAGCDIGAFEVATPGAVTGRASAVTTSSAVLAGTASNPGLVGGSAFFEYGKTIEYGHTTQTEPIAAVTSRADLSAPAAGLSPSTMYHYRLVVIDGTGTARGADQTFTTPADPGPGHKPPPVSAPRITALKVTPTALSLGRGATVAYTDTAASTTTFVVQRRVAGRVQGRSCVGRAPGNRRHRACVRWVTVGAPLIRQDISGAQRFRLSPGVIAHRPTGRYRLAATPRSSGLTGPTATIAFRLVGR